MLHHVGNLNYDPVEAFPASVFELNVGDVGAELLGTGKRGREFENDDLDDDMHDDDNMMDSTDGEREAKRARFVHWADDEDKLLLQLLHDQPYASWRDIGRHFPSRTVAAVKARGALLARKIPRRMDGPETVEEGLLDGEPSFMKVSHVWTKEDNEKLLDAINKQRGGPRKWGKIAEIFPDRTRKATEVHGMKLLMKVYGTTTTDVLDDSNLTLLCPKPSRKWTNDENEMIHHVLQTMDIANGDCWEKHIDQFRDRTVPELQLRAKYLVEKADAGIQIREDNDDDFIGYGMAMEKAPVFVPWSKEEDDMLEKLTINLPEGSGRWEAVVKMFPGRTRRAVISHARRLWAKKNGGGLSLNLSGEDLDVPVGVDEPPERIVELPPPQTIELPPAAPPAASTKKRATKKLRSLQYNEVNAAPMSAVPMEAVPSSDSEEDKDVYKVKTLWSFLEEETLLQLMQEYPNKQYDWVEIGKHFPGRTRRAVECHGIKLLRDINRFNRRMSASVSAAQQQQQQQLAHQQHQSSSSAAAPLDLQQQQQLQQLQQQAHHPREMSHNVLDSSMMSVSGDEDFAEFRTGGRRPKIMWTQEEEETLLAAMEQHQGKGRWYEIAKLFPGRSKQAIECHGVTLAKQIRMKSEKYQIPLPPMMLEVVCPPPPPPMQHLPPMMVNAPMQMPPNAMDNLGGILSNNPGTISMEMPHAMSVVVPAHAAPSHLDVMHGGGILDGDMTGESLEHFENVLLEAAASSSKPMTAEEILQQNQLHHLQQMHQAQHQQQQQQQHEQHLQQQQQQQQQQQLHQQQQQQQQQHLHHQEQQPPQSQSHPQHQQHQPMHMHDAAVVHAAAMALDSSQLRAVVDSVLASQNEAASLATSTSMNPTDGNANVNITSSSSSSGSSSSNNNVAATAPSAVLSSNLAVQSTIDVYRKVRAIPTSRSKQWSLEEDEALKSAVQAVQGHHWSKIALMIPGKTAQQCLGRWRTLNPSISHEPWTEEEDELLKSLVQRYTVDDKVRWAKVAQHLPGRRDTQCRARWCYNVNPELNLSAWSDEELKTFLLLKHELGNRWTEMEKRLPGRSVNALLSRWHCVKRRLEYFVCLKLGTSKDQLLKDVENYDFEKFFPTIEFTEEDAAEMVRVMKAGSFVGYKIAKSRASGAESIALSSLPPIRPSMSVEDQRRLVRAAASAASLNDGADDDSSVSELPAESS